jgi:hypothetical protein
VTPRSHGDLSRLPPGPPDPRSDPRHRGGPAGLRTSGPTPTGLDDGALRSPALPRPPGFGPPDSSEPGSPLSAPATHSGEAGPIALRNDGPTSWDPATELFGAPPSPVPGPGPPVLRNRLASSAGIGFPPFGARFPIPRLVSVVRPPHQRGSRSARSPVSAGAPTSGRTAMTGRQRSQ